MKTRCNASPESLVEIASRYGALLVVVLGVAGCGGDPNALDESKLSAPASGYTLGSGDRVHIVVFGQPDMTGDYTVDGEGKIAFPLIGTVRGGGATAHQLEQTIAHKLSPNYIRNPNVSVDVLTYRPFYIVGEIKNPGSYPYVNGMTIINAVALAGGFTYRAKEDQFYITRGAGAARHKYVAEQATNVAPGDVVTVRERYF